jgi:hypothetical protein
MLLYGALPIQTFTGIVHYLQDIHALSSRHAALPSPLRISW